MKSVPAAPVDRRPGGPGTGPGGRWRLWPLRLVLWATLLVIAFRGVTAIVFNQATAPRADGTARRRRGRAVPRYAGRGIRD